MPKVIVLGAGFSGCAAARELCCRGFDVVVLEARCRVGGRICTTAFKNGTNCELGAAIIHGVHQNPVADLANEIGLDLLPKDECVLFNADGWPLDASLDSRVEKAFNQALEQVSAQSLVATSLEAALQAVAPRFLTRAGATAETFNWHLSNLEYSVASDLDAVDAENWAQDDAWGFDGPHSVVLGAGLGGVAKALANCDAKGTPVPLHGGKHGGSMVIHLGVVATRVSYFADKVKVECKNGHCFESDVCLVTLPLGCLKARSVVFNPPLPKPKLAAIDRLGFGVLNKVCLLFPSVFWTTSDFLGYCSRERGHFPLWVDMSKGGGPPVLVALVSGRAAEELVEGAASVHAVVRRAMRVLKKICRERTLWPLEARVTKWRSDPYACGSYSFVGVGGSGDDYDLLAAPVAGRYCDKRNARLRLFFAGEHTNRFFPATVHGAFLSGLREALRIWRAFRPPASVSSSSSSSSKHPLRRKRRRVASELDAKPQRIPKPSSSRTPAAPPPPPSSARAGATLATAASAAAADVGGASRRRMMYSGSFAHHRSVEQLSKTHVRRHILHERSFPVLPLPPDPSPPHSTTAAGSRKDPPPVAVTPPDLAAESRGGAGGRRRSRAPSWLAGFETKAARGNTTTASNASRTAAGAGDRVALYWEEDDAWYTGFLVESGGAHPATARTAVSWSGGVHTASAAAGDAAPRLHHAHCVYYEDGEFESIDVVAHSEAGTLRLVNAHAAAVGGGPLSAATEPSGGVAMLASPPSADRHPPCFRASHPVGSDLDSSSDEEDDDEGVAQPSPTNVFALEGAWTRADLLEARCRRHMSKRRRSEAAMSARVRKALRRDEAKPRRRLAVMDALLGMGELPPSRVSGRLRKRSQLLDRDV